MRLLLLVKEKVSTTMVPDLWSIIGALGSEPLDLGIKSPTHQRLTAHYRAWLYHTS